MAAQPAGRWSPYVGYNLWHHIAGLSFGVFTLTWVLSGWLQGTGAQSERAAIEGAPPSTRPQWDALMLLLMSGVTVVCTTGAYLGYRRLTRFGLKL